MPGRRCLPIAMDWIDLRSDTVTRPTAAMRDAMRDAPVGDDVYGEDPTVNALQERLAAELGFEAALFVPSGTQSNLLALMSHCERGDEYLVGAEAHCYKWEGGGAAVLGSIQPQPLPQDAEGRMDLAAIAAAIKPVDVHFASSRLLCLENTWHGRLLPADYVRDALAMAHERGLASHLDGARLFNAAAVAGQPAAALCAGFDSVSVCFSKGLGAPVGSVLLGSTALIERARRWRKVAGGGMRQAGMLAAACLHALDHHVARLADDHARAARLAAGLAAVPGVEVDGPHTSMVFVTVPAARLPRLRETLERHRVRASIGYLPTVRLVTHLDIDDAAIERAIVAFADALD
jgi:threonine aldolase